MTGATAHNDLAFKDHFAPGPVLLLGAPGVGKGTQAQILMHHWGIPQISTGDLIRDNIRAGTAVGREFQGLVAQGIFVPDQIVNNMIADRTARPDCARGFILDGYPRTLAQAEWLDEFLQGWANTGAHVAAMPLVAISVQVRYDELLRRITGRRTGPSSKRIYNIYTNPPASPGVCDVDGEQLVQRPDDTEEVFGDRMRVFAELTAPVIDHYRSLGRFEVVNGEQSVEAVTEDIVAALKRLRQGMA